MSLIVHERLFKDPAIKSGQKEKTLRPARTSRGTTNERIVFKRCFEL